MLSLWKLAERGGWGWRREGVEGKIEDGEREYIDRERERENSNSKTFILKDSSVGSIWTYVTASPCYTTNTNKYDYTTNR